MHKLLILGSLGEFVKLIEMAKGRGYYTIVCDRYADSVGKSCGDKSYDIDVEDVEQIADICKCEGVDGIITSFSDYLFECMVKIASAANLKCYYDVEHLPLYRDKRKMKDMLTQLGVSTPHYVYVDENFADEELSGISFPVVVKPVDKYGSRGVQVLYNAREIRKNFQVICATSDIKKILVEEYHMGYEFNMMAWVLEGRIQVISIADREKSQIGKYQIPISSRNVYPSCFINEVYEQGVEILQKIVGYTGQKMGPLSMQFFWKPGEQVSVCEVAGRFFGYEHELVEYAGGLNIEKLLLDYVYDEEAMRQTFTEYSPFFSKTSAALYFHGRPKMKIANQKTARELSRIGGVAEGWLFYKDGETITEHGPNPYVARYYIMGDTRAQVDRISEHFFQNMTVTDAGGNEVLYKNNIEYRK